LKYKNKVVENQFEDLQKDNKDLKNKIEDLQKGSKDLHNINTDLLKDNKDLKIKNKVVENQIELLQTGLNKLLIDLEYKKYLVALKDLNSFYGLERTGPFSISAQLKKIR
jgi:predicted nuclease with TOPRIM domain